MADTGSPWFIPYVEPGDLVRDYPAASEALGTAIAAGLTAAVAAIRPLEVGGEISNTTMSANSTRTVTFTFGAGLFTNAPVVAPSMFHGNFRGGAPILTAAATTTSCTFIIENLSGASQQNRLWYIAIESD